LGPRLSRVSALIFGGKQSGKHMTLRFTIWVCAFAAAFVHSGANAQTSVVGGTVDIALLVAASECAGTSRTSPGYQVCVEARKKMLNEAATTKRTSESR